MPDYNLLGSQEVLKELQEGRTRELLMLLQDKPVPEVVDPLNIQSGISSAITTDGTGDYILGQTTTTLTVAGVTEEEQVAATEPHGIEINPNSPVTRLDVTIATNYDLDEVRIQTGTVSSGGGTTLDTVSGPIANDETVTLNADLNSGTNYYIVGVVPNNTYFRKDSSPSFPYTTADFDVTGDHNSDTTQYEIFDEITSYISNLTGYATDQFAAPTTAPADFKQWNAIRARDVTTGGSTSTEPVEFEILDSTDTVLNSSRIPKTRIADNPFTMRGRVYSGTASTNGDGSYTITTTGDGGHFGIPILTVVSVKKNGSVLDSANWSFDGTDTVTIDTSNVTVASGDTIDIKYDFDVFDSTLQPRAYLSREATTETSPSISHFRYEYVI